MSFTRFPRRRKYHNVKTVIDGILFDSKAEAKRYVELKLLLNAGEIRNLRHQVTYELIPKQKGERACCYVADFVYEAGPYRMVVEDVKGVRTPEYVIKRKLMLKEHGIRIAEVNVRRKKLRRAKVQSLAGGGAGTKGVGR